MSAPLGYINNTVPFSVVDGPGSRFVIFVQGCNFDCIACHNPYTISACTACAVCIDPCPEDALAIASGQVLSLDEGVCTDCGLCIDICPENSTPLATWRSVDSLLVEIREVSPFIRGITVSGGEATQQPGFLTALFSAMRADDDLSDLDILVDSNGSASIEIWDRLVPLIDGAMIDLKALDPETHQRLTARDNRSVLASIQHLAGIGKLTEVRVLAMSGYNTDEHSTAAASSWLATAAPGVPIKVLGYRHAGVRDEGLHVPETTPKELEAMRAIFAEGHATVVVV